MSKRQSSMALITGRTIRGVAASLVVAAALVGAPNAQAQSAPRASTLPADPTLPGIATQQQQDEALALATAYLANWSDEDAGRSSFHRFVAEDAVFEYPYGDDALRRLEGRTAITQALRTLPSTASNWTFSDLRLFPTLYPNVFFLAYKASAYVPATAHAYESTYLARMTIKEGKIVGYYELWEQDVRDEAFGIAGRN